MSKDISDEKRVRDIFVKHTMSGQDTELELFDTDEVIKELVGMLERERVEAYKKGYIQKGLDDVGQ